MARLKAAASIRQHLPASRPTGPTKLFKHVPARLPPSQQAINDWLDGDKPTHAALGVAAAASATSTAAQAAAGSGFVMDANTGRLVPMQASATQVSATCVAASILNACAAKSATQSMRLNSFWSELLPFFSELQGCCGGYTAVSLSLLLGAALLQWLSGQKLWTVRHVLSMQRLLLQNSEEDVASSLLGTPYMATQASHPRAPMTTPRRLATAPHHQEEQEVTYECIASHVAYAPGGSYAVVAVHAATASHAGQNNHLQMHGLVCSPPSFPVLDNIHQEYLYMLFSAVSLLKTRAPVQEEEEVRPASPKYDERSFFYTTPAAFKPAALSGRPQTQWATEGTFLGPALHADHHPTVSSQAAKLQQQQQQQQQQSEHVQNPSRKRNAAGT